jgi:hypothetical protein
MGADQPGTITADVNMHNGSSYYIGVGDYSVNTWHWYGPYSTTHVRFNVPDAEYTSGIGNLMLAVVAYDGASFDVVAIGANARDVGDSDAPPAPDAPTLTPVAGGVFAEWSNVAAGDLAGYRIYADGEEVLDYIEGGASVVIPCADEVEVRLSAVDISGNESELSDPATEIPLAGEMPVVELTATAASGVRNDVIELAATGAETYDWDIDGDGVWDFTDDPTGMSEADTNDLGVIRPAVRAHTAEGGFSLSAISLFITGNFRPVVLATADVTSGPPPLDVNFTIIAEDDDGTIDEYAWDFDGDGTFDDSSPTDPSPLPNTYAFGGLYNAKFRVTDNDGAWAIDTVAVQAMPNQPPVAVLDADPRFILPGSPTTVHFDASGSYDPEGGALTYYFDPEGDGSYVDNGADPAFEHEYSGTTTFLAKLKVEDSENYTGYDVVRIAARSFGTLTLDYTGDATYYFTSLVIVNGNPAISYNDYVNENLMYIRANDASGSSWGTPVTVDDGGGVNNMGAFSSLAVVNGNPAISYYDFTNGDLYYVRANDANGSTGNWGTPVMVDGTGVNAGYYGNSLAVVNGNPAIGYYDYTNYDLRYVRANDADGSTWGTPVTVDDGGGDSVGYYASLVVVNGNPAISYCDYTNYDLMYVRANDADGSAGNWGTPVTVDSDGDLGDYDLSMAIVNGNPAISYHDEDNDYLLKYVRASDPTGGSWGTPLILDDAGDVGEFSSLAVINGYPAISYYDYDNGNLKYICATDADGSGWGTPIIVDSAGSVGWDSCLAEVNGGPAISYYDYDSYILKYAYLQ